MTTVTLYKAVNLMLVYLNLYMAVYGLLKTIFCIAYMRFKIDLQL